MKITDIDTIMIDSPHVSFLTQVMCVKDAIIIIVFVVITIVIFVIIVILFFIFYQYCSFNTHLCT